MVKRLFTVVLSIKLCERSGFQMKPNYGWTGKILRVNLTTGKIEIEPTDNYKFLIGGKGINQFILFNEVPVNCNPYDPQNIIAIGAGPLVGTLAPGACRTSIDTKNALTGGTSSSNCGGHFAPELKFAGFDHIIITGRLDRLGYLFIHNSKVEIRNAEKYRGLTTWETEKRIREELKDPDIKVLSIGPAGENLLRTACIITDNGRAAAKGGTGGIMGSKNLKAIAVRGTQPVYVKDDNNYLKNIKSFYNKLSGPGIKMLRDGGTHYAYFESSNNVSSMPVKNNQEEYWSPDKIKRISQETINNLGYEKLRLSCFGCPIYCSHFYDIGSFKCEGFEATNAMGLGSKLDIAEPEAIIKLHGLCNSYGIDSDCAATEIAWAMELFDRGVIDEKDTDGLVLKWGDAEAAIELLNKIVFKQGFGNLFSNGIKKAAEKLGRGSIYYASHTKGEDLYESIRAQKGWALGIVVAPKGGGHCEGAPVSEGMNLSEEKSLELFGVATAGNPRTYEGKPELVKWHEQYSAAINCLGMCYYTSYWACLDAFSPDDYAKLFQLTTGVSMSGDEFMRIGLKVHNIEKAFNTLHAGFTKKDDFPPERYLNEELSVGPMKGEKLDKEKWSKALDRYYEIHGWDIKSGWQKRETLEKLELKSVADKLSIYGKLR